MRSPSFLLRLLIERLSSDSIGRRLPAYAIVDIDQLDKSFFFTPNTVSLTGGTARQRPVETMLGATVTFVQVVQLTNVVDSDCNSMLVSEPLDEGQGSGCLMALLASELAKED